jgi:hypothetical protein
MGTEACMPGNGYIVGRWIVGTNPRFCFAPFEKGGYGGFALDLAADVQ